MSSSSGQASRLALQQNQALAEAYYNIAIPGLSQRLESINAALAQGGEPDYLKQAFGAQRTGLAEGIVGQEKGAITSQLAGTKAAREGGNVLSGLSTSDIGAALANALYGSKFQEAQGSIDQTMNLMSMALGGSGTAGSASLEAARQNLGAIGYMPNYNPTYANVVGGLAGVASLYGAGQQAGWWGGSVAPPATTVWGGGSVGLPAGVGPTPGPGA